MTNVDILDIDAGQSLDEIKAADPQVSSRSRWSDPIWYFDGHVPSYWPFTIGWDFEAPEGVIDQFKLLTVCIFIRRQGLADQKFTGTKNFRVGMRYLARFMARKRITDFSALTPDVFRDFKRHLGDALAAPNFGDAAPDADEEGPEDGGSDDDLLALEGDLSRADGTGIEVSDQPAERSDDAAEDEQPDVDEVGSDEDVEIDGLTFSVARLRLQVWAFLHQQSARLARAKVAPIGFDPFEKVSVFDLAARLSSIALKEIEALPDDVVVPVLTEGFRMIGVPADDVIRLQRRYLEIREAADDPTSSKTRWALRVLLLNFRFKPLEEGGEPWHPPIRLPEPRNTGAELLTDLIETIRNAAMIVLLGGVGWRLSEACSVEVDDRTINGNLPSCIFTTPSLTRTSEHFWVKGLISKMRRESDPEQWLLGARPMGSRDEPPTVRAIRVLERLLQPWRRLADDPTTARQLLVRFRENVALPTRGGDVAPMMGEVVRRGTRKFIVDRCGLEQSLAPLVTSMPRLKDYHDSKGACIRPHQWRHTYFQTLIRIDPKLLPALSDHFKHTDMAMTENAYGSKRGELETERQKASLEQTVMFFARQRKATGPTRAKLDKTLRRNREAFEKTLADFGLDEEDEAIKALCLSQDLRVFPAEHGTCLVALNPDEARCHVRGGSIDWRVKAPNYASREAGLCTGCANFSIGVENIPYWRRRYVEFRTAWVQSGRHPSFRFALQRSIQAAAVLRSLDAPVPLVVARPIAGDAT